MTDEYVAAWLDFGKSRIIALNTGQLLWHKTLSLGDVFTLNGMLVEILQCAKVEDNWGILWELQLSKMG